MNRAMKIFDHVTLVGIAGTLSTIALADWNMIIGIIAGVTAIGYTLLRAWMLIKKRLDP